MMIMALFIDREKELQKLQEIALSPQAELVLLYGRRRVGKSKLLLEFTKRTDSLYLLADLSENILEILAHQINDEFVRFNSWEDFFEYLLKSKYRLIIIDEFQYLYQVNKAWPTQLQRWWEKLKETDKKIILCGSIISTIYKIAMGYGSALYGRKTREMLLEPLKFKYVDGFLTHYNFEKVVETYAILGGIPRYLEEFNSQETLESNILKKIIDKTSFLYNEPLNLFFEEFRDPAPYVSILLSISQGYVKFHEIAEMSHIQSYQLPKYLLILERAGIIKKEIPITEKKIKTKTTRYIICDHYFKFWFKFIFRNKAFVEQERQGELLGVIRAGFSSFVGHCFEDICLEIVPELDIFPIIELGRWWSKDKEIDIIALHKGMKKILFGECKWQEKVDAPALLSQLREKALQVDWQRQEREEYYVFFAKSFKKRINDERVHCFDLKDLEKVLRKK